MRSERIDSLRTRLLAAAADGREPRIEDLETRPVFLLGPGSVLGQLFMGSLPRLARGLVAVVDDFEPPGRQVHGVPCWSSAEFLSRAADHPAAVAIDFGVTPAARALFAELCRRTGVERQDAVVAQAQLGFASVYETVVDYRAQTLARLDEFLALAERIVEPLSRETLYANLLFRLTCDRTPLLETWSSSADEYFSPYTDASTFRLGHREHYVDCGAYRGPIVSKFLGATGHRYASITAFEPDAANYEALRNVSRIPLENFRPIQRAVSNRRETLRFAETGTVSSHVTEHGDTTVEATTLDDEIERLTFLKMDVEGHEAKTLQGGARTIARDRPRIAACVYHYANDLLDVVSELDRLVDGYHLRLRQHYGYYWDLVLYASPVAGTEPHPSAA